MVSILTFQVTADRIHSAILLNTVDHMEIKFRNLISPVRIGCGSVYVQHALAANEPFFSVLPP